MTGTWRTHQAPPPYFSASHWYIFAPYSSVVRTFRPDS